MGEIDFQEFAAPLIGMELTHIWRGYGSAIFLEFGELHHKLWKTGRLSNNPSGEFGISLTWSWRIEGHRRIWCGSWSEEEHWQRFFSKMIGATVKRVNIFGCLPEIDLELSCGVHVLSFMTANGDPEWSIHYDQRWLSVKAGRLYIEKNPVDYVKIRAEDICMLPIKKKPEVSPEDESVGRSVTASEDC